MKCEKCNKEITELKVTIFNYDGSDSDTVHSFHECEENAVVIDVDPDLAGNELEGEEMADTISCPHCGEFPFKSKEIQTRHYISVAMFKDAENTDKSTILEYEEK